MDKELLHRFERNGTRYVIDPETCFCFECDAITWDVLAHFPGIPVNRICHELGQTYDVKEIMEVLGELEWLRSAGSILPNVKREDYQKRFDVEGGLKRVSVELPADGDKARTLGQEAVDLLLGRALAQKELTAEFVVPREVKDARLLADLCAYAFKRGRLAGKKLSAVVHIHDVTLAKAPKALEGHALSVKLEFRDPDDASAFLKSFSLNGSVTLSRLTKTFKTDAKSISGIVTVRPGHPDFGGVAAALDEEGFGIIELDLSGAFSARPDLAPDSMLPGLSQSAMYYAQQLLKRHYFRLDPIAPLFWHIYSGTPLRRSDPAGTNELAVDTRGDVYPSRELLGVDAYKTGSLVSGEINEQTLRLFDDLGSLMTAPCMKCWARNLCGGGNAGVHHALTGSFRTPQEAWCDAQRAGTASAVSAFNVLSSHGVNFTRVYNSMSRTSSKASLFTMARAMFQATIGMRPIEEADAEMLTKWENWNEASYFLFNATGTLMAVRYDREMDALHPRATSYETILTRKDGKPFGLLKFEPDQWPGTARGWLYMRRAEDYADSAVRKGFRFLLKEAAGQQAFTSLVIPAAAYEQPLQEFLTAVGFERQGAQREALFLHDKYHDVNLYRIALDKL